MSVRTARGTKALIRVSMNGSGSKHYHVILSATTGLNGAKAMWSFETLNDANDQADSFVTTLMDNGYRANEVMSGTVLRLDRGTTDVCYLFVRPCYLRHAR